MNDTLSHIEAIVACSEIESLWSMHAARMDDYGFDRLIYGFTGFKTENSLGDADDFVILSNHDPAYLDAFLGRGLYTNAPMMDWALNNVGAKSWAVLQNGSAAEWMTEEARHVHEFNRQHLSATNLLGPGTPPGECLGARCCSGGR